MIHKTTLLTLIGYHMAVRAQWLIERDAPVPPEEFLGILVGMHYIRHLAECH